MWKEEEEGGSTRRRRIMVEEVDEGETKNPTTFFLSQKRL